MRAMVLRAPRAPLVAVECDDPIPGPGEVLLKVLACGVCRTDLHIADGDLPMIRTPTILGHEVVGRVEALGPGVTDIRIGERRGVPWLGATCGACAYCLDGMENLCDRPQFTGWSRDGGYAEKIVARGDFTIPIPEEVDDLQAAPLLCAGLIGFRAWRAACDGRRVKALGLYGFGAAAHLLAPLARFHGQAVHAFTRPGDAAAMKLALEVGCAWAGGSDEAAVGPLDAAIIFAPAGALVPKALAAVRKGGVVVCAGIHMSDIPSLPYALLWGERRLCSVANLTRDDARDYLPLALEAGVRPIVTRYGLSTAGAALDDLRAGRFTGAAVLTP